jgi:hypothetical protein
VFILFSTAKRYCKRFEPFDLHYYKREAGIAKANLFASAQLRTTFPGNRFREIILFSQANGCALRKSGCQSCACFHCLLRMILFLGEFLF